MTVTKPLHSLLDDLGAYLGTPDAACVSLPPAAYTSGDRPRKSGEAEGTPGVLAAPCEALCCGWVTRDGTI